MDWDIPRTPTSILVLIHLAAEHGVPTAVCLRGTGLHADHLEQTSTEVTARHEQTVIENVLAAVPDNEDLGLQAGNRYHLTTYGIWGFALISSPTLRSAVDIGLRYMDLTFAFSRIRVNEDGGAFRLVLDAPGIPAPLHRYVIERDAAAIRLIQRELFDAPIPDMTAQFTFPPPRDARRHTKTYGVTPRFDATENSLSLPREILDLALPRANAHTAAFTQSQCRELLEQRHARAGLSGRVRDLLLALPAHPPSAEQTARQLQMSSRTLRHRLATEGTSYRELLDEVRRRLAEEMLTTGRLTVAETAQRLGYVELSSFSQAFRRWNGMGPRAFRSAMVTAHR